MPSSKPSGGWFTSPDDGDLSACPSVCNAQAGNAQAGSRVMSLSAGVRLPVDVGVVRGGESEEDEDEQDKQS